MVNRLEQGVELLEGMEPGLYDRRVAEVLARGGVIHLAPDCMLLGWPSPERARTLHVSFACGSLPAIFGLLCGLRSYDRVRFMRALKGSALLRERDIKAYARHLGLAEKISFD